MVTGAHGLPRTLGSMIGWRCLCSAARLFLKARVVGDRSHAGVTRTSCGNPRSAPAEFRILARMRNSRSTRPVRRRSARSRPPLTLRGVIATPSSMVPQCAARRALGTLHARGGRALLVHGSATLPPSARLPCSPRIAGRGTVFPAERTKQGRRSSALLSAETRCIASAVTPVGAPARGEARDWRRAGRSRPTGKNPLYRWRATLGRSPARHRPGLPEPDQPTG